MTISAVGLTPGAPRFGATGIFVRQGIIDGRPNTENGKLMARAVQIMESDGVKTNTAGVFESGVYARELPGQGDKAFDYLVVRTNSERGTKALLKLAAHYPAQFLRFDQKTLRPEQTMPVLRQLSAQLAETPSRFSVLS